jgi:hypothetical protein
VRTRSVRRAPLVTLAAVGTALLLGGCGSVPPGTASVVGGTKISRSDVNELADAQCAGIEAAAKSGQGQAQQAARKRVVQQSLYILMDTELSLQYGESEGIAPRSQEVAVTTTSTEPFIKSLPKKYHSYMEDFVQRWAEGRDVMTQVGEKATGQQPDANNAQSLLDAGYQKRDPWLKSVDIDTDPRYGPTGIGLPGGADPSVSKAVSSFAKSADKDQPDPAWVGALPAGQKCG